MSFSIRQKKIIGEDYVKMIQKDEKSMNYATYQLRNSAQNLVMSMHQSQKACQILRTQAKEDLDVVKGQYVNGMVDETKNDDGTLKKTGDGIATNQNKFFFDIINGVLPFFSNFYYFI